MLEKARLSLFSALLDPTTQEDSFQWSFTVIPRSLEHGHKVLEIRRSEGNFILINDFFSNYAPTLRIQRKGNEKYGTDQALWLLHDYVTEVGTMNFFLFWKNEQGENELITPPLDGTILPGVTRDSILTICREMNEFKVSEKPFKI